MALSRPVQNKRKRKNLWFERLMALIALANLGLVGFDLSYIQFRDFYLRRFPRFTQLYGEQFKGIEPHRSTTAFTAKVEELEDQVAATGLSSPQVADILVELQRMSGEVIDENPFEGANKTGTLERIKNRMRDQVGVESSKEAFTTFWTADYLSAVGWSEAIAFYNDSIEPLFEVNYFRSIGEDGNLTDRFWLIDRWFVGLFAVEFLLRTLYLSRRYQGTNWIDAVVWRWYDLLLLIPFWRWLRVVPVTLRLGQAKLVNLSLVGNRIRRAIATNFAIELTEIVVIRVLDQVQNLIRDGEVRRFVLQSTNNQRYVDINGIDEVEVISKRVSDLLVDHILPKVKPDLDALLSHSITSALASLPLYRGLGTLPNFEQTSHQLINGVVGQFSQRTYEALQAALRDEKGALLVRNLVSSFGTTARQEAVNQEAAIAEIEGLLTALLDEIKINYVKRLSEEDLEELQAEAQQQVYELSQ